MNHDIDVYRNIHKAIRAELFATTADAGRLDAADDEGRAALGTRVERLVWLLTSHAHHEDEFLQPLIEAHLPAVAERVVDDHAMLDARIEGLAKAARQVETRREVHELYLDLAGFTGTYLLHQELEEREIHPGLLVAVGPEVLFETEQALVASIPPPEMADSLSLMLPAMNVDDRTELLGGIRMGAPAEVFAGICALAESVLEPADMRQLAGRLGL